MGKNKETSAGSRKKAKTMPSPTSSLSDFEGIISAIQKTEKNKKPSTSTAGLPPGWRKATFIVKEQHFQSLKALSYDERISVKAILEQILERFLSSRTAALQSKNK